MSESFANKPPSNPDKDTVYTMGGLQDIADFIGSAEQIAQLYPGGQNRPEYEPGLSDLRYTRSFQGAGGPGGSFYTPSGAGNAPAPFQEQIIYQQPMIQPGGDGAINEALLGALFGMDWTGAYEDYINKLESQRDVTNFMPNFTYNPSFDPTFNPTYAPSTDIDVSPTISPTISNVVSPTITQNPNITVNPNITNTLEQTQQQTMGGGSKTGQTQGGGGLGFDFGLGDDSLFDADIGFADDGGVLDSDFFTNAAATGGARTTSNTNANTGASITQSPSIVVSPTISNTLSQWQKQWMGGSQTSQDDDKDDDDDDDNDDNGEDTTQGGNGNDTLIGGNDNDTLIGGNENDTLIGGNDNDTLTGGNQNDTIIGGNQNDTLVGGNQNDTLIGGNQNDTLIGGNQNDTLIGGNNNDTLTGGNNNDTLIGGNGNDTLIGGNQNDTLWTDDQLYIKSIYQELFEREADQNESKYWADQLASGKTREQIIRDIAAGALGNDLGALEQFEVDEFLGKQRTTPEQREANLQTVKDAYQTLFDRDETDPANLNYWTTQLNLGKSSTDLLRDMVSGAQGADVQTAANTKTVNDLYNQLLDRPADEAGLDYFRAELAAGATPEEVARNIISGAQAGDEASKISQEEYDRYFKQAEDTSTPTPQSAVDEFLNSLTPERLQQIQDSAYENKQLVQELQDEARQYVYGMILTPGITPEQLREGFFRNVIAGRPDLLEKLFSQDILDRHVVDFYSGEGGTTTSGTDTRSLSDEFIKRATDPDYIQAALSIAGLFGEGSGGDSGTGVTAEEAILSGGGSALVTFGRSLLNGEDTDKAIANAATSAAVNAALYFGGPYVQAAYFLDKILAKEFGYDSFVQDGIAYFSRMIEKGTGWVLDKVSEFFGGAFDSISDVFNSIGDFLGFAEGGMVRYQEGGLVDLPGEMPYNYTNYYGALSQPQPYMPPLSLDEVQPEMAFAGGGLIPLVGGGKIASGPGGGLDDLIPTSIDGRRAAALSDGEFVIPADVVSMMGDGSTNAGSKRLYDLVRQVRQEKTGTSRQAGPLQVGKILERTMR